MTRNRPKIGVGLRCKGALSRPPLELFNNTVFAAVIVATVTRAAGAAPSALDWSAAVADVGAVPANTCAHLNGTCKSLLFTPCVGLQVLPYSDPKQHPGSAAEGLLSVCSSPFHVCCVPSWGHGVTSATATRHPGISATQVGTLCDAFRVAPTGVAATWSSDHDHTGVVETAYACCPTLAGAGMAMPAFFLLSSAITGPLTALVINGLKMLWDGWRSRRHPKRPATVSRRGCAVPSSMHESSYLTVVGDAFEAHHGGSSSDISSNGNHDDESLLLNADTEAVNDATTGINAPLTQEERAAEIEFMIYELGLRKARTRSLFLGRMMRPSKLLLATTAFKFLVSFIAAIFVANDLDDRRTWQKYNAFVAAMVNGGGVKACVELTVLTIIAHEMPSNHRRGGSMKLPLTVFTTGPAAFGAFIAHHVRHAYAQVGNAAATEEGGQKDELDVFRVTGGLVLVTLLSISVTHHLPAVVLWAPVMIGYGLLCACIFMFCEMVYTKAGAGGEHDAALFSTGHESELHFALLAATGRIPCEEAAAQQAIAELRDIKSECDGKHRRRDEDVDGLADDPEHVDDEEQHGSPHVNCFCMNRRRRQDAPHSTLSVSSIALRAAVRSGIFVTYVFTLTYMVTLPSNYSTLMYSFGADEALGRGAQHWLGVPTVELASRSHGCYVLSLASSAWGDKKRAERWYYVSNVLRWL